VSGTNSEYFNCSVKRMEKLNNLILRMPSKQQLAFIEFNQCKFDHSKEAQIALLDTLNDPKVAGEVQYFTLFRCRICPTFVKEALVPFLFNNESLIRFSFVLNNDTNDRFIEE